MVKFPAPARDLSLAQNNTESGGIQAPNSMYSGASYPQGINRLEVSS